MNTKLILEPTKYTGEELRSHWIYKTTGISGDSIVGFIGECEVKIEHMVDYEDVLNNDAIYSPLMLNFIAEFFTFELTQVIAYQRLLISNIKETLEEFCPEQSFFRYGDDIFYDDRKMSVSIATLSPVSCLIHTGININNENTPIPTSCLSELNIDSEKFANRILEKFKEEIEGINFARTKVRATK